jgi:hypothetical protein
MANQPRLDPALLFAALQVMPVEWTRAADYAGRREEAESRIGARDLDDWPTVAEEQADSRAGDPPVLSGLRRQFGPIDVPRPARRPRHCPRAGA